MAIGSEAAVGGAQAPVRVAPGGELAEGGSLGLGVCGRPICPVQKAPPEEHPVLPADLKIPSASSASASPLVCGATSA
ncbi:hypothetical protein [Streptomyces ureilyticus]|uniref:Uncharacterized protein n=1 Tax=Streptomyces ureilyticus TaxID=1775131 RepID=A0ABX0E4F9_9ACTN|nr:hypothetical protein [Streptomyces ureilyticus]NGO46022.1 hypothetical protein [Streptomyces ureilyticus]